MAYPHDGIAKTLPGAWLLPNQERVFFDVRDQPSEISRAGSGTKPKKNERLAER
jgi:hypothetical protein